MKHIALGVNIGNLGPAKRLREPMLARCNRINDSFEKSRVDLRVISFYRHTGNLVLETTTLQPIAAAQILSDAEGGIWMAVSESTMRRVVEAVRCTSPPQWEDGIRWTPGAAFAVTKPACGTITSTSKVRLLSIDLGTVAAWKRDRLNDRGRLDKKMREGGWGAVSGAVADQTGSQWTARSLSSLEGVLDRATPVRR